MKREDFIYNLTTDFKSKEMEQNFKFSDFLGNLCDKIGEIDYQHFYDTICQGQGHYKSIPKQYKFYKYAEEKGLLKSVNKSSGKIWAKCSSCGKEFSYISRKCPFCGSGKRTCEIHTDSSPPPDKVIQFQELCYMCKVLDKAKTDDKVMCFGPSCDSYGTDWKGYPFPYCERCKCLECCKLERRATATPDVYKEDLKEHRIKEPWLNGQ